jgi:TatD DNase family protein
MNRIRISFVEPLPAPRGERIVMPGFAVDFHAHLTDTPSVEKLQALLARAGEAEVRLIITAAARPEDFPLVKHLKNEYNQETNTGKPTVWGAFGVHPWYAGQVSSDWEEVLRRALAEGERPIVGEIGLDYGPKGLAAASKEAQRIFFRRQLEIAEELAIPSVIHSFRAGSEAIETAAEFRRIPRVLFHGFVDSLPRGTEEERFFFSYSPREVGVGQRKGRDMVRRLAERIPEQILPESDWPARGNEPAGIPETISLLEELGARPIQGTERFLSVFNLSMFGIDRSPKVSE